MIKQLYGTEELRVESNFIAILLPASLSLMTINMGNGLDPTIRNATLTFFGAYILLVFYDLMSVSMSNARAKRVQGEIYMDLNTRGATEESTITEGELRSDYEQLENEATNRKYVMPLVKVLAASFAALVAVAAT